MAYVVIDERRVEVLDRVTRQTITPFNIGVGTGDLKRSDISLSRHVAWENFGGGIGLYRLREGKETDQGADASGVWGISNRQLELASLKADLGIAGTTELIFGLYFRTTAGTDRLLAVEATTGKIFYWVSGTTWTEATDVSAITDLCVYRQGATDYVLAAWGTNYSYSSDGITWAAPNPAVAANYFTVFDNKLVKIASGNMSFSTDPAGATPTWTNNVQDIPDEVTGVVGNWRNASGEPAIAVATRRGLWSVDFWTQTKYLLLDLATARMGGGTLLNIGERMKIWNGSLMIPHGLGLIALRPDGTWAEIGLRRGDGLVGDTHANSPTASIVELAPLLNYLLCLIRDPNQATRSSVMAWTGSAWHPVVTGVALSKMLVAWPASNSIYVVVGNGAGGQVQQAQFVDAEDPGDPFKGASTLIARMASGTWTSAWSDLGFAEFEKVGFIFDVIGKDLTDTETVKIEYQINDDESAWYPLGITVGTKRRHSMKFSGGAGLPFFTFRFRATLARGSTTTRTPKVDAFVLRYLDAPNLRFAYNFSVRTRDDEEIAFYEALALQKINFPFNPEGDLAGPMEYVRITNGPTIVGIDDTGLRTLQMTVASPT